MAEELETYRGKSIIDLSRDELIKALKEMYAYYESRLSGKDDTISIFRRK